MSMRECTVSMSEPNVRWCCPENVLGDCTPPLYGMIVRQHCPSYPPIFCKLPWYFYLRNSNDLTPREFLFWNSPAILFRKILNYKNLYSGFPEKFWHSKIPCAGHTFSPILPTSSHFAPQYISNVYQRASNVLIISTPMKVQNSTWTYSILYNWYD